MAIIEPRAFPDDHYSFNLRDLKTLIIAIERFMESKEVMHTQEAADFLGISASKLYRMDNVPHHKVPGFSGKVFLRSELIDYIKRH